MYKFRVEKNRNLVFSSAEMPLVLSKKDSKTFINVLLNDTEPNDKLKKAAKRYKENISE